MLNLEDLKKKHDKAFNHNTATREKAADDSLFYWVTQWNSTLLGESSLQYRGEFNIIRKAGRQIVADLRANEIQIQYEPKDESRTDGADLIDGLYRADDRVNLSIESYDNASLEAVVCGVGAWELYTEYKSNRVGDDDQVIRRRPVYEANNNCFWDPNAKRMDKSDAKYCSILEAYSIEGYADLVEELTGTRPENVSAESFKHPEHSYVFPWYQQQDEIIYVTRFYQIDKIKDVVYTMTDMMGQTVAYRESDLKDLMDELIDSGYTIKSKKTIRRNQVTQYIASGEKILDTTVITGEYIPVIPCYGERAFVEGEECYEGVTRLAKDPQRLRNFQMSYLADIVSRSPRPKPIFNPEQIQGFEDMYAENGADNNYPYLLQNRTTANGEDLPPGPVAIMPEQNMPQALGISLELSRQAVEDVANPGLPQNIADPDLSGKAVLALQNRLDQQSMVYQQNMKHAKRRDAEVYASMATEVYDAPRKVKTSSADGTQKEVEIMESVLDEETGEMTVLNDLTNMEFEVYADIGPNYASRKEQTIEQLGEMADAVVNTDPELHKALIMKMAMLVDGVAMEDIREHARKQLLITGFTEPETDEDKQLVQEAQQAQQPDPAALIGQAEMVKAESMMLREQTNQAKFQIEAAKLGQEDRKINTDELKAVSDIRNTDANTFKTVAEVEKINADILKGRAETLLRGLPSEMLENFNPNGKA